MKAGKIGRRALIGGLSIAAAASVVSLPRWKGSGRWRFFTDNEALMVDAICAQLIPRDQDPGAREAAVVNYIDIQLTKPFKRYRGAYRQGLAGLERASLGKFGTRFVELTPEKQVAALREAEENSKEFFELILAHCRQGFYGDPRHGGNRNMASWKMLRLPFPMVRGRMHYDDTPKRG